MGGCLSSAGVSFLKSNADCVTPATPFSRAQDKAFEASLAWPWCHRRPHPNHVPSGGLPVLQGPAALAFLESQGPRLQLPRPLISLS